VKCFQQTGGSVSGGTLSSVLDHGKIKKTELRKMRHPYFLNPGKYYEIKYRKGDKDPAFISKDKDMNKWVGPFIMGAVNCRVVRRSNALFTKSPYGENFEYTEYQLNDSFFKAILYWLLGILVLLFILIPCLRYLGRRMGPAPGRGPTKKFRKKSYFRSVLVGESENGKKGYATLEGKDPYDETGRCASEAALCLLQRRKEKEKGAKSESTGYGFLTPAKAFGPELFQRLQKAGLKCAYKEK